mgnify:CR=1 FL=1
MDIIVIEKDKHNDKLSQNLAHSEFKCKCSYGDCTRTLILDATLRSFELTRKAYKKPIMVTSGFRCQKHNKDIGGKDFSHHKVGAAIDLTLYGPFLKEELDLLDNYARLYFDIVLRYDSFIHCHNLDDSRLSTEEQ